MKSLRVWVLVLLAVLLPIRGGMAATMMCGPVGTQQSHHQSEATDHGAAHAEHAHHDVGGDQPTQDRCNLCSASCSTPPLPSESAGLDEPVALGAAPYPSLSAPAPTFQSDGQERPPRTI